MSKYIDAEKLIAEIESIRLIPQTSADYNDVRDDMKMMVLDLIDSLQQEQPDKRGYKDCNGCEYNRLLKDQIGWQFLGCFGGDYRGKPIAEIELCPLKVAVQQEQPKLPGIEDPGIPGKDFIPVEWVEACERYGKWRIVKQEQPEVDLEEAARHVYESWMGGTMDDVCRDMVELGKVLNARK